MMYISIVTVNGGAAMAALQPWRTPTSRYQLSLQDSAHVTLASSPTISSPTHCLGGRAQVLQGRDRRNGNAGHKDSLRSSYPYLQDSRGPAGDTLTCSKCHITPFAGSVSTIEGLVKAEAMPAVACSLQTILGVHPQRVMDMQHGITGALPFSQCNSTGCCSELPPS